jgi:hypothetical protein
MENDSGARPKKAQGNNVTLKRGANSAYLLARLKRDVREQLTGGA